VADRRDGLSGVDKLLRECHCFLVDAQRVRIQYATWEQQRVVVVWARLRQRSIDLLPGV
jgi:hypothetical protein